MAHQYFTLRVSQFLVGCILLCPFLMEAQGWQRFYGGPGNDRAFAVQLLPNGSMVAAGSTTDTLAGTTDWYFLKADSLGNLLQERKWGNFTDDETALAIMPWGPDGWFVAGSQFHPTPSILGGDLYGTVLKINASDSLQEVYTYEWFTAFNEGKIWNKDYLLVGAKYAPFGIDSYAPRFFYQKIDTSGAVLWQKDYNFGQYGEAENALTLPNGNAFVTGSFLDLPNLFDIVVVKTSPLGDSLTSRILSSPGAQKSSDLLLTNSGNLVLVATDGLNTTASAEIMLVGLSQNLDSLWTRRIPIPGNQQPHAALILPNGNIAIAGEHIPEGSSSRDGFLALADSSGNLLWFKTYGGLKGDIFWDLKPAPDGNGFIIAGQTASFSPTGDLQAWLLRTDSLGTVWSNRVVGRITRDVIENCVIDANEPALPGWLVVASGEPGTLYTLSDSMGAYSIAVDTGTWFVSVLPPSGYWSPCEDSVQVDLQQFGDTLAVDFPVQSLYDCPLLDVDLTTPYLRRCYENTYTVRYYNYGTLAAPNAVISIELDPFLTPTGSTLPYIQSGDSLIFSIGQVASLAGGTFQFTTLLDCDSTVLGQTHCVEANIFPDSLCYQFSPDWDGASLEVDGTCMGDSVLLTITNTGLDMQGSVNYIIVEDQIIFKMAPLQLSAGQDTSFVIYPGGSTVTIIVPQTPGHPGNSQPMLVIEGCGGIPFSTGYVLQFPQNDGDFSTDIECRQSIGSFDPNDKIGLPEGVGEQHVIAPETTIEYLIRFQNTGTDTAFRVEIRDSLPASLDLATFREGASSHSYQLGISGSGLLSFLFDPIALPDSGANWAASQGFVKFRISPKKGLALGTRIENQAAIYFDQNTPVLTAFTLHTLDDPFKHLITSATEPINTNTAVDLLLVSPNPTHGNVLVNLAQPLEREGLRLGVLDALGREVRNFSDFSSNTYEPKLMSLSLDLSDLPSGIYFLELKNPEGKILARGKVLKI